MKHRAPRLRPSRTALNLVLGAIVVVAAAGCFTDRKPDSVGPQDWWEDRGPVIPHDTFPADCALCHTSDNWQDIRADFHFDHEQETGVKLEGAHATAECLRCHNDRGPVQMFAVRGCAGCHEDVHEGQLGSECKSCHTENDWQPFGQIAQHARTRFPLVGAHAATLCIECHAGAPVGNFSRAEVECISCHQKDLKQAVSPDHVAQGWTDNCQRCHISTTWQGAGFTHAFFPLVGGHAGMECIACHANGIFAGTSSSCVSCHIDKYNNTTSPNHQTAGFGQECEQCHTIQSWQGATFAHTVFPLTGKHATTACDACHVGGVFQGTPTTCVACHQSDYDGTTDPNHAALGYSTQCQTCHTTTKWQGATFDHSSFPLTGKHATAACSECHIGGVFQGTPSTCVACHQSDYDGTTDPNHAQAGYSTQCQTCHSTSGWDGASFDHSSFPLTGKHVTTACTACHVGGVFQGTPNTCVGCHQSDYDTTNNPNHAAAGFPTTCDTCHTTSKWTGANFSHPQFPITSGKHKNIACSECHLVPTDYAMFSCIDCHTHNKQTTDNHHDDVNNYSYNSQACYACHPKGKGGD